MAHAYMPEIVVVSNPYVVTVRAGNLNKFGRFLSHN